MNWLIIVREESPGQFTAWPAGLPELRITSPSHTSAVLELTEKMAAMARRGELVSMMLTNVYGIPNPHRGTDPFDPDQIAYREDLERFRREDRERSIQERLEFERLQEQKAG